MPLANYTSEIDATVSYTLERSRFSDDEQGDRMVDMELHDLWMMDKSWRKSELREVFGPRGLAYIEKYIFSKVEAE